jgi:hypothetical protein
VPLHGTWHLTVPCAALLPDLGENRAPKPESILSKKSLFKITKTRARSPKFVQITAEI